jgi:hypothetical protein
MTTCQEIVGATWGENNGLIERVHFIADPVAPNGHLTIGKEFIPVRAEFVEETEATARETPNLQNARESWGNFKPIGDFEVPLPPLVQ